MICITTQLKFGMLKAVVFKLLIDPYINNYLIYSANYFSSSKHYYSSKTNQLTNVALFTIRFT